MAAPLVLDAKQKHTGTIIFLHGLGDTGAGWADPMENIQSMLPYLKVILPTAPIQPVSLNGGMSMTAWYDIVELSPRNEDIAGLTRSSVIIKDLIEAEVKAGIPSNRIIIGGFSQGAAVSLFTGFSLESPVGGILAFSGYLPGATTFLERSKQSCMKTPVLMCHGSADMVIRHNWGQISAETLKSFGVAADFKTYKGMPHSACPQEIVDATKFIQSVLPPIS